MFPTLSQPIRSLLVAALAALPLVALAFAAIARANTSHAGWPQIDGMLLMNKLDQNRPLDGRPGHDPFDGTDARYRCDGLHKDSTCVGLPRHCHRGDPYWRSNCKHPVVVTAAVRHNELLGGHGNDRIHAGPAGDVIWGDYKPSSQPTNQVDRLYGGLGRDFIYTSHGWNRVVAGRGADVVHAHFGHGIIDCGAGRDILYVSHRSRHRYRVRHCDRISYKTLGY